MAGSSTGSGRLRHRIKILRELLTDDGLGGQVQSFPTIARPYADVTALGGRTNMIAHALQGISAYRIRIRWRGDIFSTDQIELSDGTKLNISAPPHDPDDRRQWLVIMADTGSVKETGDG